MKALSGNLPYIQGNMPDWI